MFDSHKGDSHSRYHLVAEILQCKHPLSTEHGTSSGCGQSSKCRVHLHGSCGVMDFSELGTEMR